MKKIFIGFCLPFRIYVSALTTINVDNLDPECALRNLVLNTPVRATRPVRVVLNNAFGMLGINCVTIITKYGNEQ